MIPVRAAEPGPSIGPAQRELMRELIDLKRVRSAGRDGSVATRLFRAGWAMLVAGAQPDDVAARVTAAGIAAARLGDLDHAKLLDLGLTASAAVEVLRRGFDELAGAIAEPWRATLRAALAHPPQDGPVPRFVRLLEAQPRAGVTCPGKPRLMLEPAESHADHCFAVAVGGAALAPCYGAEPAAVFMAGMAHHLHSAPMPDSGFSGEVLLGDALDGMIERARARSLAELAPALAARVRAALAPIAGSATPEACAFHAADVLDRVLEIESHLNASRATTETVLHDHELVHAGPVKAFHDRVLAEAGIA